MPICVRAFRWIVVILLGSVIVPNWWYSMVDDACLADVMLLSLTRRKRITPNAWPVELEMAAVSYVSRENTGGRLW